jgi:hypothetical protein
MRMTKTIVHPLTAATLTIEAIFRTNNQHGMLVIQTANKYKTFDDLTNYTHVAEYIAQIETDFSDYENKCAEQLKRNEDQLTTMGFRKL